MKPFCNLCCVSGHTSASCPRRAKLEQKYALPVAAIAELTAGDSASCENCWPLIKQNAALRAQVVMLEKKLAERGEKGAETVTQTVTARGGRGKRIHQSHAERQRAYRERKKEG